MWMSDLALAQFLAVLTAFGFASGDTSARFALRTSTPITATLTVSCVTLVMYGPFALTSASLSSLSLSGAAVFLAAGVSAPGLARTFLYMSFNRIGMSRSTAFISISPLVTVFLAIVALGERPTPLVYLGTLLIVGGVLILTVEQKSAGEREGRGKTVWYFFVYAMLAMLTLGIASFLRKVGVALIPSLSVGLCLSAVGTLAVTVFWNFLLPSGDRIRFTRQSALPFLLSGIFTSLAHLAFFSALQRASLSTVAPLVFTVPLFALGFSWLLFREVERMNARLLAGVVLICGGAVLVTMARG